MTHHYEITICWTGNLGSGTSGYKEYSRDHIISAKDKPEILASSDSVFQGDSKKYNPEDMLVASLSSCHMLWYLHLCADHGITVTNYEDQATGIMEVLKNGSGHFTKVTLYPKVLIKETDKVKLATELHEKAHQYCFIANSCNFPIHHIPTILVL